MATKTKLVKTGGPTATRGTATVRSDVAVELSHVSHAFGDQQVLRDLSFRVRRGETLALIGESGCGKSVTTKLLAGLLAVQAGDVLWDGRSVRDRDVAELRRDRLRMGYLFQGAALFDSMSVFENIAFGLRENTALRDAQIREIVADRLREVGLSMDVGNKHPADLSGGMRKRVGLARALAMSPDVMFYDEPTTGLDPIMSGVINDLILQTQQRRKVTSIVVTHDMTTVRHVADQVVMLYPLAKLKPDERQMVFSGTGDDVFASGDPRVAPFVGNGVRPSTV
ncbi:ABC transporter ATP-binding protein [Schlesneria paludicola]|uniref:ABC transporter ATP-binding protein n=1 Tax=Schlesneria paludicola TaxID=360056 RepID=UPI00029A419C|nr:ATP-binding cassette domain-containing protein [Schlesneria paludicola]